MHASNRTWWGSVHPNDSLMPAQASISTQGLTARNATVFIDEWCTRLLVVRHWRNLDIAHPSSAIRLSTAKEASLVSTWKAVGANPIGRSRDPTRHYIRGGMRAVTLRFIFRPLSSRFFKPQLNNHHQFLEAVGQPGVPDCVT